MSTKSRPAVKYDDSNSVGIVATEYMKFAEGLLLDSGKRIAPIQVAYETYGELNEARDNAVLISHGITGDAHCAGFHKGAKRPGYWEPLIGPGKVIDTNKYFVVSTNALGGCMGTTGPASVNPKTGKPYGMSFPVIDLEDMVRLQKKVLKILGVRSLKLAVGGSMGGMQSLKIGVLYPDFVRNIIAIGTPGKVSPRTIGLNKTGRLAIMQDPKWNNGDYYDSEPPEDGLALARMIGVLTYKCEEVLEERFGRDVHTDEENFDSAFAVEKYLDEKGVNINKRFDANSYLYLTKAVDLYDLGRGFPSYVDGLKSIQARVMMISMDTDILFPPAQVKTVIDILRKFGKSAEFVEIKTMYGHDAFLIEFDKMAEHFAKIL